MASFDKLPSGKWRATVVTPIKMANGRPKRITHTHALKGVVEEWAKLQEGAIAAGSWRDLPGTKQTLAEYRDQWREKQLREKETSLAKVDSLWRTHLADVWGGHPLAMITRPELLAWVKRMSEEQCSQCKAYPGVVEDDEGLVLADHKRMAKWSKGKKLKWDQTAVEITCEKAGGLAGLGAWTVHAIVGHLSTLMASAVRDGALGASPVVKLDLPSVAPKPIHYWTTDEAAKILLELGGADALAVETDMYVGLRPGELFGLRRRYVDTHLWQVNVYGVATRRGWKPYAKTKKSHRAVPVPKHLRARWADHLDGLAPDDLVFPAPDGGTWDDREFAKTVFGPAVERAGVTPGTPYGMRHTAASWLVQRGVELQRVQELLGHEKYSTTLRYAHLQPKAFDAVLDAWGDAPLDPRSSTPRPAPETSR